MSVELQRGDGQREHTSCGATAPSGFARDGGPASPAPGNPWLGILMLETRFERVPGDIGHPASFDFPVRYRVVAGASPQRVVREGDASLLQPFIDAGRALAAEGAAAIATSCGFLVQFQRELQAALPVPVWTSSLLALPVLQRAGPVGVVTIDAAALGSAHLRAAGADPATPVEGVAPGCHLQRALLDGDVALDTAKAERDVVAAALRLVARRPDLRALVLECTNMPPYADAVRAATGLPVHDIRTMLHDRWHALARESRPG
jgi:hypothetical protein